MAIEPQSERESSHNRPAARLAKLRGGRGRIDPSEAAAVEACHRIPGLYRLEIVGGWIVQERPVKDVREFSPNTQAISFLHPEGTAQIHVLLRVALIPVIAVIRGAAAELAFRGIGPGSRIEGEGGAGVVTAAVEVAHGVKGHTWHTVGERGLKQLGAEAGICQWRLDWQAASVLKQSPDLPVAESPTQCLLCLEHR